MKSGLRSYLRITLRQQLNMGNIFNTALEFNQNIGTWNTSSILGFLGAFLGASDLGIARYVNMAFSDYIMPI